MTEVVTPPQAVEALAMSMHQIHAQQFDWTELHPVERAQYRDEAEHHLSGLLAAGMLLAPGEVKVLTETAAEAGRRIGWKAAAEEIAVRQEAVRDQIGDGAMRELCHDMAGIARYIASQPSQAASDATSGVPGHPEVSEAVRSPQEPCEDLDCPIVLMHSHPEGNTP